LETRKAKSPSIFLNLDAYRGQQLEFGAWAPRRPHVHVVVWLASSMITTSSKAGESLSPARRARLEIVIEYKFSATRTRLHFSKSHGVVRWLVGSIRGDPEATERTGALENDTRTERLAAPSSGGSFSNSQPTKHHGVTHWKDADTWATVYPRRRTHSTARQSG
jgi:hypothetical protein